MSGLVLKGGASFYAWEFPSMEFNCYIVSVYCSSVKVSRMLKHRGYLCEVVLAEDTNNLFFSVQRSLTTNNGGSTFNNFDAMFFFWK